MTRVFVYGTLKRGGRYHEAWCHGLASAAPARVRGRLYALPYGYPALVVPAEDVLALGTRAYDDDARRCAGPAPEASRGPWVRGEVHLYERSSALGALDRLEGYLQEDPEGLPLPELRDDRYLRVLVPAWLEGETSPCRAWTYVWSEPEPPGTYLPEGEWCEEFTTRTRPLEGGCP